MRLARLLVLVMLARESTALTQAPADERPPDPVLAEEALPSEVGEWEIRLTSDFSHDRFIAPQFQVFFGVVERVGGELAAAFSDEHGSYGPSFVGGSLKWLGLPERGSLPAVIIGLELEAATIAGHNPVEMVSFVSLAQGLRACDRTRPGRSDLAAPRG